MEGVGVVYGGDSGIRRCSRVCWVVVVSFGRSGKGGCWDWEVFFGDSLEYFWRITILWVERIESFVSILNRVYYLFTVSFIFLA